MGQEPTTSHDKGTPRRPGWPWIVAGVVVVLFLVYAVIGLTLSLHIPDSRALPVPVKKERVLPLKKPAPKRIESSQ